MHTPKPRPLFSALALLLAATACSASRPDTTEQAAASPPEVTQEQKDQAILQYAQMRQMEAVGTRCGWLGDIEQVALAASLQERQAWMSWQQVDSAPAEAKAKELVAGSAGIECKSTEGEMHRTGIGYGAWQMRSSWAMRGYSLLPGADAPAWYGGKSSVASHRPALQAAIAGLKAIDESSVQASIDRFKQESEQLLAIRCKQAEQGCPTANADAGWRNYGKLVLQQTEIYAAALEKVNDKSGRPPAEPAP